MKTIGFLGGMSWESSAEYYRIANELTKSSMGGHNNARSLLLTLNFQEIEELQKKGAWDELGRILQKAACDLEAGGADFIVLCTNTMHKLAKEIEAAISIPLLHIADPTAAAIKSKGFKTVGLLGTRFTMEESFYRGRLEETHGLRVVVPDDVNREIIHRVIYEELCHGTIVPASKLEFQRIIDELNRQGAEAVILGCTEISLLIKREDSDIPLFDTTLLHATAAVEMATL